MMSNNPRSRVVPSRALHARRQAAWSVRFRRGLISGSLFAAFPGLAGAAGADPAVTDPDYVQFNRAFLGGADRSSDVSRFEQGATVLPGTYSVDLYVNDSLIAREPIVFRVMGSNALARPCFEYATLLQMGVDVARLDASVVTPQNACIDIANVSPNAKATMNVGELRLDVSIPQASLQSRARGYVSPAIWNAGETALTLSYNLSAYTSTQRSGSVGSGAGTAIDTNGNAVPVQSGQSYALAPAGNYVASPTGSYMLNSSGTYVQVKPGSFTPSTNRSAYRNSGAYLGLNVGLNVYGWRIRGQETATWDQFSGKTQFNSVSTTASHDITPWKAQITVGDSYTQGVIFDNTPFRGVTLYSDDRMQPDSQQGFAPVVRGVANTQARVQVMQRGILLYETTVPPGPFVISDLFSTGYGGNLTVNVLEADGSTHSFVVPYAAVPMLIRPGMSRWAITQGRVHDTSQPSAGPYFMEGTYQRGINNWFTLYGGVQTTYSDLYKNGLLGVALNTPVGAMALDVAHSITHLQGASNTLTGSSARVSFARVVPSTRTSFTLATYRYSNQNYLSLLDAAQAQSLPKSATNGNRTTSTVRVKQRIQLIVNQDLGGRFGSFYVSGEADSYWGGTSQSTFYQIGYTNSWRNISFSINAGRTFSTSPIYNGGHFNNQYGVTVSIPLGIRQSGGPNAIVSAQHDDASGSNARATLADTWGDTNQYSYNVGGSYSNQTGAGNAANGSLSWRAPDIVLNGGYSYGADYRQASVGASGGLVIHRGGLTFSPQMDVDSPIAIVHAPGAEGARVSSSGLSRVDHWGYAIATGLTPYRLNDVTLDPEGTSEDVELQTTRVQTAPRAGAVVPLEFGTKRGRAVLITAKKANGEALPFGAQVLDANANEVGSVGQGSQVYLRSDEQSGVLTVRWGRGPDQRCELNYNIPVETSNDRSLIMKNVHEVCR